MLLWTVAFGDARTTSHGTAPRMIASDTPTPAQEMTAAGADTTITVQGDLNDEE